MPCHVLISMHDMQEFTEEHLHKLALSSTEGKGRCKRGVLGVRKGVGFRKEREGWCSVAQPVYERIFDRFPENVMRIVHGLRLVTAYNFLPCNAIACRLQTQSRTVLA